MSMSRALVAGVGFAALLAIGGLPAHAAGKQPAASTATHVASGEVVKVGATDQSFVVRMHGKGGKTHDVRFVLPAEGKVTKNAQPAAFSDIHPKEKVHVTYRVQHKQHYAEQVEIGGAQTASSAAPAPAKSATTR